MPSSRFLYVPTTPSGGDGGNPSSEQVDNSAVRLVVRHPIFDGTQYLSVHNHVFNCTFMGNFTEAGSNIDFTQWRLRVGDDQVLIRYYDDDRRWWWEVDAILIDEHPNPNGTDIVSGFVGSEKDDDCDVNQNVPLGQLTNSVVNFNEAPDVLLICGGDDPFDPNLCVCTGFLDKVCALVATVDFISQGTSFHIVEPASQGARKYDYRCFNNP